MKRQTMKTLAIMITFAILVIGCSSDPEEVSIEDNPTFSTIDRGDGDTEETSGVTSSTLVSEPSEESSTTEAPSESLPPTTVENFGEFADELAGEPAPIPDQEDVSGENIDEDEVVVDTIDLWPPSVGDTHPEDDSIVVVAIDGSVITYETSFGQVEVDTSEPNGKMILPLPWEGSNRTPGEAIDEEGTEVDHENEVDGSHEEPRDYKNIGQYWQRAFSSGFAGVYDDRLEMVVSLVRNAPTSDHIEENRVLYNEKTVKNISENNLYLPQEPWFVPSRGSAWNEIDVVAIGIWQENETTIGTIALYEAVDFTDTKFKGEWEIFFFDKVS